MTFLAWMLLALASLQSTQATEPPQPPDVGERIRALAAPLVERGDFAGAIAIDAGHTRARVAMGWADRGLQVPNRVDTRFGIGSVSKQFTAAVILRLVEDGVLQLSDSLSEHLAEFAGPPVTVHQLLAHRSGLARDPLSPEQQIQRFTSEEIIELVSGLPREFEPGERTSYSNSGFVILALLAEAILNRPYCDVLQDLVLQPLGLNDTGCLDTAKLIPGLAHGYDPGPGPTRLRPAPHYEWTNTTGAGGLYSTVDDLARWGRVILQREFLRPESWDVMLADHGDGRGYGIATYTRHGHTAIGHDGVINGYTAFLEVYPAEGAVVAYAGNIRAGGFELMETVSTALALGLPADSVAVPQDVDRMISREEALALVGRYELFPGFHLDIFEDAGRLYLKGTGGYPTVLSSLADGAYFYRAMYATIGFDVKPEGAVLTWVDRHGQEYTARKVTG